MQKKLIVFLFALFPFSFLMPTAIGHEERDVGPISITVGWAEEPAIAGLQNAVQVELTRGDSPVTEDVSLRAEVTFEDEAFGPVDLQPLPGTPGEFRAPLIPTISGAYVFTITGQVGGTKVDQEFEPGPETFAEVEGPSALQFPEEAPTDAETGRAITRLQEELGRARSSASSAQTQAKIGIGAGVLGLVAAAVAISMSRKKESR